MFNGISILDFHLDYQWCLLILILLSHPIWISGENNQTFQCRPIYAPCCLVSFWGMWSKGERDFEWFWTADERIYIIIYNYMIIYNYNIYIYIYMYNYYTSQIITILITYIFIIWYYGTICYWKSVFREKAQDYETSWPGSTCDVIRDVLRYHFLFGRCYFLFAVCVFVTSCSTALVGS